MTAQRGATLQVAGKAGTFSMEKPSSPLELARLAKAAYQSGAWRSVPRQGGAFEKYRYLLRSKCPEALLLPELALRALVKSGAGCGWCAVRMLTALDAVDDLDGHGGGRDQPELEPDPVLLELLGQPCTGCKARYADRAARREAARQAEAGAAARAAIGMIEANDGRLAAAIARVGLRHHFPPAMVAAAIADVARPQNVRRVSGDAVRPVRPAAAPQRPAPGLSVRVPDPSYYRKRATR